MPRLQVRHPLRLRERLRKPLVVDPVARAGEGENVPPAVAANGTHTRWQGGRLLDERPRDRSRHRVAAAPRTRNAGCRSSPSPGGFRRRRTEAASAAARTDAGTPGPWCATLTTGATAGRGALVDRLRCRPGQAAADDRAAPRASRLRPHGVEPQDEVSLSGPRRRRACRRPDTSDGGSAAARGLVASPSYAASGTTVVSSPTVIDSSTL